MERDSHTEEILHRPHQLSVFALRHILRREIFDSGDIEANLRDPEEEIEISEAAGRAFDIGLHAEGVFAPDGCTLLQLLFDEGDGLVETDAFEDLFGMDPEMFGAADESRLQQGGLDRMVAVGDIEEGIDLVDTVSQLEPAVPEYLQQQLDDRHEIVSGCLFVEDHHVDIGVDAELLSAVGAHRDDRDRDRVEHRHVCTEHLAEDIAVDMGEDGIDVPGVLHEKVFAMLQVGGGERLEIGGDILFDLFREFEIGTVLVDQGFDIHLKFQNIAFLLY